MKVALFLDAVNNSVDNAMQWSVMNQLALAMDLVEVVVIDAKKIGMNASIKQLMEQEYDALLTYNKTGTNLKLHDSETFVLREIKRLQICWLTEPIFNFFYLCEIYTKRTSYIFI